MEESLKKVCSKATWKSRYQCLLLLFNLCKEFDLEKKDTEENLLYFIKYYGILVRSDEESELWESVIQEYDLSDTPASLGFEYYNDLEKCFLPHFESLVCYESGKALHIDGFYALTKTFPELIEHYRYRVNPPKSICSKFMKAWLNESCSQALKDGKAGRSAMKKICYASIKKLNWDELDKAKDKIREWNQDRKRAPFTSTATIDMEELRALLTEIAIKGKIMRVAKQYLSEQIQLYYSSLNEAEIN